MPMIMNWIYMLLDVLAKKTSDWWRWGYINIMRIGLNQAKTSRITDISILYRSEHFVVVNKREDVKINSDNPRDYVTVSLQLKHLFPETYSNEVAHGYRYGTHL